jgi:hypothetical protein
MQHKDKCTLQIDPSENPTLKKGTKKVAYGSLADIVRGLPHTVLLHIIGLAICTAQVNLID